MLAGYAICKECNAGTFNNLLNTKFGLADGIDGESEIAVCLTCGGSHIDGELFNDFDDVAEETFDEFEADEDEEIEIDPYDAEVERELMSNSDADFRDRD